MFGLYGIMVAWCLPAHTDLASAWHVLKGQSKHSDTGTLAAREEIFSWHVTWWLVLLGGVFYWVLGTLGTKANRKPGARIVWAGVGWGILGISNTTIFFFLVISVGVIEAFVSCGTLLALGIGYFMLGGREGESIIASKKHR